MQFFHHFLGLKQGPCVISQFAQLVQFDFELHQDWWHLEVAPAKSLVSS